MILDYGENIYEILSEITGLKFKAQVKNCGIEFKKIYLITDLEKSEEYYFLVVDQDQITFRNKTEFIEKFIVFLEKNIIELDSVLR